MADVTQRLSAALSDRYRIERRLGDGGMTTVYLGEDLTHNRKVAIKVLRPELAAALGAERFLREITTTANLRRGVHQLSLLDPPRCVPGSTAGGSPPQTVDGRGLARLRDALHLRTVISPSLRGRPAAVLQPPSDGTRAATRSVGFWGGPAGALELWIYDLRSGNRSRSPRFDPPRLLAAQRFSNNAGRPYAVAPDEQRFLIKIPSSEHSARSIRVILDDPSGRGTPR